MPDCLRNDLTLRPRTNALINRGKAAIARAASFGRLQWITQIKFIPDYADELRGLLVFKLTGDGFEVKFFGNDIFIEIVYELDGSRIVANLLKDCIDNITVKDVLHRLRLLYFSLDAVFDD